MILDIKETINDLNGKFNNFVENQADNPFFWLIVFGLLLAIGIYAISKFANK